MSGAQDEECEQEQELDFQFDGDDVENALRNVRQIAAAANDTPPRKRRKSLGEKKRGPPQSKVPKRLEIDDPDVTRHLETDYGYRNDKRYFSTISS